MHWIGMPAKTLILYHVTSSGIYLTYPHNMPKCSSMFGQYNVTCNLIQSCSMEHAVPLQSNWSYCTAENMDRYHLIITFGLSPLQLIKSLYCYWCCIINIQLKLLLMTHIYHVLSKILTVVFFMHMWVVINT